MSDCLFTLRQGTRSVAKYMVEFGTEVLGVESAWNEPELQNMFRRGLNGQVCDALVVGDQRV